MLYAMLLKHNAPSIENKNVIVGLCKHISKHINFLYEMVGLCGEGQIEGKLSTHP